MSAHFSIRAIAEETGLSVHTIRAWERRYGVLSPLRTGTNRRVYTDEDVRRLKLLCRAVESGHSIGMIAAQPTDELQKLVRSEPKPAESPVGAGRFLDSCRRAIHQVDSDGLDAQLLRASSLLGVDGFLRDLVLPLIAVIDDQWSRKKISIAEEHLFSALLKNHLGRLRLSLQADRHAPMLVVSTPANQHHELGAMIAAIVAAQADWKVTYLGPNLPAQDIAFAARRARADAVALSIVYPAADPQTQSELEALGSLLDPELRVIAGGRAAPSYASELKALNAIVCRDLDDFREAIGGLRPQEGVRR